MTKRHAGQLVVAVTAWFSMGVARAEAAATCAFDSGTGVLTVTLGGYDAELKVETDGTIRLDGALCGGSTRTSTSRIQVNGSNLFSERVTLTGAFAPGRDAEADSPEIEFGLALDRSDSLIVNATAGPDAVVFTAGGLNLNGDSDVDMVISPIGWVTIRTLGGNDLIDASAYTGISMLHLFGGVGNDRIYGSPAGDYLYGQAGNDILHGGAGRDWMFDGPGADQVFGDDGSDLFDQGPVADAGDVFIGGAGSDWLSYRKRKVGLTVTVGDGMANDGEPNEADNVGADVEDVDGGSGDDVLVGTVGRNGFDGGAGNDELYGGGGDDYLEGGSGADIVVGDGGNDQLYGSDGDDSLDGGAGNDYLSGDDGDDTMDGGPDNDRLEGDLGNDVMYGGDGDDALWGGFNVSDGNDELHGGPGKDTLDGGGEVDLLYGDDGDDKFYNDDGNPETVHCGPGVDDAEPSPGDSFDQCEL